MVEEFPNRIELSCKQMQNWYTMTYKYTWPLTCLDWYTMTYKYTWPLTCLDWYTMTCKYTWPLTCLDWYRNLNKTGFGWCLWCLTPLNNISVILWRSVLLVEETGVPEENHRPVANHWLSLSHNIVLSTPHYERGSNSQL